MCTTTLGYVLPLFTLVPVPSFSVGPSAETVMSLIPASAPESAAAGSPDMLSPYAVRCCPQGLSVFCAHWALSRGARQEPGVQSRAGDPGRDRVLVFVCVLKAWKEIFVVSLWASVHNAPVHNVTSEWALVYPQCGTYSLNQSPLHMASGGMVLRM